MRIAVVEDDPAFASLLASYLQQFFADETARGSLCIDAFCSGRAFLQAHHSGRYALLFFDCILETGTAGIDVARQVRDRGDSAPLVFVTCSPDFAIDGYEVSAAGYLVKPLSSAHLAATLHRIGFGTSVQPTTVTLGSGSGTFAVDPRTITHAEARGHYALVHTATAGSRRIRIGFADLAATLAHSGGFYLCARGRLVNLDYVDRIDRFDFVLYDGARIPISQRTLPAAKRAYADHLFDQMRKDAQP